MTDKNNSFVLPAIVLAEIKPLISRKRIAIDYNDLIEHLSNSANNVIYPIDEGVIEEMPEGLEIHDALIVATGLIYKNALNEDVRLISDDEDIIKAGIIAVV